MKLIQATIKSKLYTENVYNLLTIKMLAAFIDELGDHRRCVLVAIPARLEIIC